MTRRSQGGSRPAPIDDSDPVESKGADDADPGFEAGPRGRPVTVKELFRSLSLLDRLLPLLVFLAMVTGVLIGNFQADAVHRAFSGAEWDGVSIPLLIGLLIMIWPPLAKVQWERLPKLAAQRQLYFHLLASFLINWVLAPLVMVAVAWIALPEADKERERRGVVLVGVARCIAMVLIWTGIAQGDGDYCAILVVFNSVFQMVLFAPYSLLFCNILARSPGSTTDLLRLSYPQVSRAVGVYLGIPLGAGAVTRLLVLTTLSPRNQGRFFRFFGPLALLGLLYVIIVLFANQGKAIIDDIGTVFRICVPLILYFTVVWTATFFGFWRLARSRRFGQLSGGYDKAVTQAFTSGSNNFELAIAVAVASFGTNAPEVLAATLGPLIEVPVLLALSYVALYLRGRLRWTVAAADSETGRVKSEAGADEQARGAGIGSAT